MNPEIRVGGELTVVPGAPARVDIVVRNPADVAQRIHLAVVGLDPSWRAEGASQLLLDAGSVASVTLTVTPPRGTLPGRYPFVVSAQASDPESGRVVAALTHLDAAFEVGADPRLSVRLDPPAPAAIYRRRVNFVVDNTGGEPANLAVEWGEVPGLRVYGHPGPVQVPAGGRVRVPASFEVRRPRLFGAPRLLPFQVNARGGAVALSADAVFTARALIKGGLTKALVLLVVVALWAGAALVAINKIANDARKSALAGAPAPGSSTGALPGAGSKVGAGAGATGTGGTLAATRAASPSAPGVIVISGTVSGASGVHVALSPTSLVDEASQGANYLGNSGLAAQMGKIPASAIGYQAAASVSSPRSTVTAADGSFAFAGVKAPGYYLLIFSKPGYQVSKYVIQAVASAPPPPMKVRLVAGGGALAGTVTTTNNSGLGGAALTITDGSDTASTSSATVGQVGHWSVSGLSTPGTYLVSASRNGYATASALVQLAAGGASTVHLALAPGVASLVGTVTGPNDTGEVSGLGGMTVTATDGQVSRSATTVTTGPVGAFTLARLPVPATYTVTISGQGYLTQTRQVQLTSGTPPPPVNAVLTPASGVVTGIISGQSGQTSTGLVGAGLVLAGPSGTYKTMSASTPTPGQFALTGVAPGNYVLTGERFGYFDDSVAVAVGPGGSATANLTLTAQPSGGLPATAYIKVRVVDARTGAAITCPAGVSSCDKSIELVVSSNSTKVYSSPPLDSSQENTVPPATGAGLVPGLYQVTASAPGAGYQSATVTVAVAAGESVLAPVIALQPLATLTGTLTTIVGSVPTGTCVVAIPSVDELAAHYSPSACKPSPTCTVSPTPPISPSLASCEVVGAQDSYSLALQSGSYGVFVLVPSGSNYLPPSPAQFQLIAGDTQRFDVTLNRYGEEDLAVYQPGASGNPVAVPVGTTVTCAPVASCKTASTTTDSSGLAVFKGLSPSVAYTFAATVGANSAQLSNVVVDLNQVLTSSLVVAGETSFVVGRVVTKVNGVAQPVPNAQVTMQAVSAYNGSIAVTKSVTVTADNNGCFAIIQPNGVLGNITGSAYGACASDANLEAGLDSAYLAILAPQVTVSASATGYPTLATTQTSVSSATLLAVTMAPPATPVTGCVAFASAGSPNPKTCTVPKGFDPSKLVVRMTSIAPGAGNVVVTANSGGTLVWTDPTLSSSGLAYPGNYTLAVSYPGYDTTTTAVSIPLATTTPAPTTTIPPIVVYPLGTLVAQALDAATGAPVDGATFVLSGSGVPTTSATAPPGSNQVSFTGLIAGSYSLSVQAAGYQQSPSPQTVSVSDGPGQSTVAVALSELGEFSGTVSAAVLNSSGTTAITTPLAGAVVTATDTSTQAKFTTTTDSTGQYYLTGTVASPGLSLTDTFTITASAPGYQTQTASSTAARPASSPPALNFTLPENNVCLVVTLTNDSSPPAAISGATLTLTNSQLGVSATPSTTDCSGTSAAPAGNYVFAAIQPAQYTLSVKASGYQPLDLVVNPQPGLAQQTVSVVLAVQAAQVTGQVQGQTGTGTPTAVSGASVQAYPAGGSVASASVTTDGNGGFSLSLAAGSYSLKVTPPSGSNLQPQTTAPFTLTSGQVQQVDVTLYAYTYSLTVTVVTDSLASTAGSEVSLVAAGSGAQSQGAQTTTSSGTSTDTSATTFNQVVAGTYNVISRAPDGHVAGYENGVSVTAATSVTITERDLRVSIGTDPTGGAPAANVSVSASDGSENLTGVSSGSAGADVAAFLVPWQLSYAISASASGYVAASASLRSSGSPSTGVTKAVTLAQFGALSVLISSGGSYVAGKVTATGQGVTASASTDGTSPALLPNLPPGSYTVTVSSGSGATAKTGTATPTVSPGVTTSLTVAAS